MAKQNSQVRQLSSTACLLTVLGLRFRKSLHSTQARNSTMPRSPKGSGRHRCRDSRAMKARPFIFRDHLQVPVAPNTTSPELLAYTACYSRYKYLYTGPLDRLGFSFIRLLLEVRSRRKDTETVSQQGLGLQLQVRDGAVRRRGRSLSTMSLLQSQHVKA